MLVSFGSTLPNLVPYLALTADPLYHGYDCSQEERWAMGDEGKMTGDLAAITAQVRATAQLCQGDSQCLLSLLRLLEGLHREIRTEEFEPSLPDTRNALYQLLRQIEESGGWPYIERMRLRTFLTHFFVEEVDPQTK